MSDLQISSIRVPFPQAGDLHARLSLGACRLKLAPGAGEDWISGTYSDPSGSLPYRLEQQGGTVRLTQAPDVGGLLGILSGAPSFDLALGTAQPYALTLEGGASENRLELGGLPLQRLALKYGAGKIEANFSTPNPVELTALEVSVGAAGVELRNLANANFARLNVEGGAASYLLDFGGRLQRNAEARVSTGISSVEIRVPETTALRVTSESVLGSLDVGDGWTKQEGAFCTPAAMRGDSPVLTVRASVALGSLQLRLTRPPGALPGA